MTALVANVEFGQGGNSDGHVLEGWAAPEAAHRWTMGRGARLTLPRGTPGAHLVLVVNATPCLNPPTLAHQVVMLAVNERLVATIAYPGLRVLAFRLFLLQDSATELIVSITHVNCAVPRASEQYRDGEPLGLAVHSVRLYETMAPGAPETWPALPGQMADGTLAAAVRRETGLNVPALAACFESIGQACQFGHVQRSLGCDPLSLLRFTDGTTSALTDGLFGQFAGIGAPGALTLYPSGDTRPHYIWRHRTYGLTFHTRAFVDENDADDLARAQSRRLAFLQRKFIEDIEAGEKIFVLTRTDLLSEPEALAVYCALSLHGPVTLLWTQFGDPRTTGQVTRHAPGFLCGHLGPQDDLGAAAPAAWISVLARAMRLKGRKDVPF